MLLADKKLANVSFKDHEMTFVRVLKKIDFFLPSYFEKHSCKSRHSIFYFLTANINCLLPSWGSEGPKKSERNKRNDKECKGIYILLVFFFQYEKTRAKVFSFFINFFPSLQLSQRKKNKSGPPRAFTNLLKFFLFVCTNRSAVGELLFSTKLHFFLRSFAELRSWIGTFKKKKKRRESDLYIQTLFSQNIILKREKTLLGDAT